MASWLLTANVCCDYPEVLSCWSGSAAVDGQAMYLVPQWQREDGMRVSACEDQACIVCSCRITVRLLLLKLCLSALALLLLSAVVCAGLTRLQLRSTHGTKSGGLARFTSLKNLAGTLTCWLAIVCCLTAVPAITSTAQSRARHVGKTSSAHWSPGQLPPSWCMSVENKTYMLTFCVCSSRSCRSEANRQQPTQ
jgi:hypothetical protein